MSGKATRVASEARYTLMHFPFEPTLFYKHFLAASRKITFYHGRKVLTGGEKRKKKKGSERKNAGRPTVQTVTSHPSSQLRLTTINGIFLLSHSSCFFLSPLSLSAAPAPSFREELSIGLLNNADPLHQKKKGPRASLIPSVLCFQLISSFRKPSSVETGNNDLLHPVECQPPSPPQIIQPLSPMKLSPHGTGFS